MASDGSDAGLDDNERDPVTAEYDIFLTTPLDAHQLYVLQYPNRAREETFKRRQFPSAMRIKPTSGFIEMDVPIHFSNYDKARGIRWGQALKSAQDDGVTSFGVASGFTQQTKSKSAPGRGRREVEGQAANEDDDEEDEDEAPLDPNEMLLENFESAVRQGRVLRHQTLGGQITEAEPESGKPVYMLGAFRGNELHLTPATGIVQMRPQFHHIDAQTRVEALARKKPTEGSAGAPEAQAMYERQKGPESGDADAGNLNKLQQAKAEAWTQLQYHHEDTPEAYNEYYDALFVEDPAKAPAVVSCMSNAEYLDAISAPRSDDIGRLKKKPESRRAKAESESEDSDVPVEIEPPAAGR